MIIDTNSSEMKWILLKFLRDSLDFLADDPNARNNIRGNWAKTWMNLYLSDESIKTWMVPGHDYCFINLVVEDYENKLGYIENKKKSQ